MTLSHLQNKQSLNTQIWLFFQPHKPLTHKHGKLTHVPLGVPHAGGTLGKANKPYSAMSIYKALILFLGIPGLLFNK